MKTSLANKIADILDKAKKDIKRVIEKYEQNEKRTEELTKSFLMSIDWKSYEAICIEYLIIKKCNAKATNTGADEGIDIIISNSKNKLTGIAQCKRWDKQIGVNLIREFFGVMASKRIEKGIFFTTSNFTHDAVEFCKNKKIILIDGNELIKQVNRLEESQQAKILNTATKGDYMTPTCAQCDEKMVKRISKKGWNAGNEFWGCINYPKCESLINIKKHEN
jgi:restriction system protein